MPQPKAQYRDEMFRRRADGLNAAGSRIFGMQWTRCNEAAVTSAARANLPYTTPAMKYALMRTVLCTLVLSRWPDRRDILADVQAVLDDPQAELVRQEREDG